MSQQGPGGYGGGGPYGPPGGGGYGGAPPGGGYPPPGGAPPGGYGPPGGPPGYGPPQGAPPGYSPPQQGYGGYPAGPPGGPAAPPPKKSNALLFVGLGCGVLMLLGIGGGIATYFYMKSKVSEAETAIANLAAGGAGVLAAPGSTDTAAAPTLSPTCAKAAACCTAMVIKTSPANGPLAAQVCAKTYAAFADNICAQHYASLKTAAKTTGATCE